MELYYFITIVCFVKFGLPNREIVTFITPDNCSEREYYIPSLMTCTPCNDHQKSSLDRLSCVCEKNSRIVDKVLEFSSCKPCPSNLTATFDHMHCLKKTNITCGLKDIELETEPDGSALTRQSCVRCSPGTSPSADRTKCLPCPVANCTCPPTSHELLLDGTLCVFSQNLTQWPDERETHTVEYDAVGVDVESKYLKKHLRALLFKCVKMKHRTSCETLGNLCTVQMYKDERKVNPCRVFKDYRRIPTSSDADRLPLPWIYYGEGDASVVLNRKKITSKYTIRPGSRKSELQLVAARYDLNGSLIKISELSPDELQLCPGLWNGVESAFRFGARYVHSCNIPARQLIRQGSTEHVVFYDLYLQHDDGKKNILYAIPLLVRNIKVGTSYPNKGRDTSQWLLTRRMFLMDMFSGISIKTPQGLPTVIQYLKSVELVVQAQREIENEGNIYPPFIVLEYGQITDENVSSNALCPVTFTVEFYMENDILHYVDMGLGILSGCVFIWSCIHTWNESKRCGRMAIDLWTVGQFAITCCSHFANMIFAVCTLLAIHTLFFYKAQSVVYILLPSQDLEVVVNRYVVIAFILKIVEIVRLIWKQTTIDIFLVDWEKPRILPNQKQNGIMTTQKQTVSIWRSYFVANEWAEIQTKRKISLPLQLLFTVLLLKIYGLENWAAAEPEVHLTKVPYRPISQLLGFGMLVIVFSVVYLVQWITTVAIYERYINNCIQQFVDICSLANISVFILSAEFFGYYIHGRSAHGFSDTDMESLIGQLRREEDNMVRHRGLMPGTENQTFEMTVPSSLKTYYRRVMAPLNSIQSKQISGSSFRIKKVDKTDMAKIGQAYNNMNKFLAAFLDHALKDLDYEIREKTFVEKLLGIEYSDPLDKGVFFIDDGHSFDQVIFYGNECTLIIFDLMMLSFFYVLTENIVLAGIITGLLIKVMSVIRTKFGKRNLAKKTLIDERFLI